MRQTHEIYSHLYCPIPPLLLTLPTPSPSLLHLPLSLSPLSPTLLFFPPPFLLLSLAHLFPSLPTPPLLPSPHPLLLSPFTSFPFSPPLSLSLSPSM